MECTLSNDDVVERLNKQFAVVEIGAKMAVMEFKPDGEIRKLWDYSEFGKKLMSQKVDVGSDVPKLVPLSRFWLEHRSARRYWDLVYAMPGSGVVPHERDYNGWRGYTVEAKQGSWERNQAHMLEVIAGGSEEVNHYLMNWMAAMIQKPGLHANTAIVMTGDHGVGKGHFANYMLGQFFYPQQYCHLTSSGQLTGRFNEHLSGKAFIFADEATWGGDPRASNILKALVTEDTIPMERKFLPQVDEPSSLHIVIASNSDFPVRVERTDRRFTILEVGGQYRENFKHFTELHDELDNGGRPALMHDLMEWKVDWPLTRRPIVTAAKKVLAAHALNTMEQWWYEKLVAGVNVEETQGWHETVLATALHDDYINFTEKHFRGLRHTVSTMTQFGIFLKKVGVNKSRHRAGGTLSYFRVFPFLEVARKKWGEYIGWGDDHDWDADDDELQKELPDDGDM